MYNWGKEAILWRNIYMANNEQTELENVEFDGEYNYVPWGFQYIMYEHIFCFL